MEVGLERQVGVSVVGWFRDALGLEAGGLCEGLGGGDEGRVLSLFVFQSVL